MVAILQCFNPLIDDFTMFNVAPDTQRLVFQLVGLIFIITTLTGLPGALSFVPHVEQLKLSYFVPAAGHLLQLCAGLWLVLRPNYWAAMFLRLRGQRQE